MLTAFFSFPSVRHAGEAALFVYLILRHMDSLFFLFLEAYVSFRPWFLLVVYDAKPSTVNLIYLPSAFCYIFFLSSNTS